MSVRESIARVTARVEHRERRPAREAEIAEINERYKADVARIHAEHAVRVADGKARLDAESKARFAASLAKIKAGTYEPYILQPEEP